MLKARVKANFDYKKLLELGYQYDILEAGYISKDFATIVYQHREPYIGEVGQFSERREEQHFNNIQELKDLNLLESEC